MTLGTLISVDELAAEQGAGRAIVLVDASFDLADTEAGERSWRDGHLPGSVYLNLDSDLSGIKTGANGRHPLPERAAFAATLGRVGIRPDTLVVAFDRQGGPYAARLWWMLRWMGHEDVAVLDGGVGAWLAAGGTLATGETLAVVAAPPYPDRASLVGSIDVATLQAKLGSLRVIDARAGERFRGEVEPLDRAAGHIPGAQNRFFKDNLAADGRFKPAAELRAAFGAVTGGRPLADVVHQCGSGVTACHNLLAMEHAGLVGTLLYPGSWSDWSSDPARPIAQG